MIMKVSTVAALAAFVLTGCSQHDKVEAGNQARRVGQEIKQTAAQAQKGISDGSITLKVKTAMGASDRLDTGDINVDTVNRVVHLKGTVPDAAQKTLAERIAHDTVGSDVTIMSHLAIRSPKSAKQVK